MAQNDFLKKYLDAGLAFTSLTQARAEALVKDLVKVGEVQADQARDVVVDLLERSRKNTEKLVETVRHEVRAQITGLGLASREDLDRLEARVVGLFDSAAAPLQRAAGRRLADGAVATSTGNAAEAPAQTSSARDTDAKKTPAKKATAQKAPAKKATAQKAPAKKATAKKATAKKTTAKKTAAKKTAAKKTAPRSSGRTGG